MSKNIFDVFEEGDIDSLAALIGKLEESSFDFLKLESEDVLIVIGKNGMSDVIAAGPAKVTTPFSGNGASVENGASAAQRQLADGISLTTTTVEKEVASTANKDDSIPEPDGFEFIKAPTHGLYYAQSEPGAPSYVQVGDNVKAGDIVGLLEIMKVFNALTSHVDGEITKIHVQNMDIVEPGQILLSVKVK